MTIEKRIVEQSSCGFVAADATAEDVKSSYLKRQEKSPCLDKLVLLLHPAYDSIRAIGASEHFKVGRFHEIDHSTLSPTSPVQLKSVRIVMVSDIGEHLVSLRYPSLQSLRTHFSDQSFGKPNGKKIPALDEKYMMGMDMAIKALVRSIPTEEFAQRRNSWSFWVSSPSNENPQEYYENPPLIDAARSLICKQGSCWSQLKFTGMVQWGKRRQVRFLGRHEEQKVKSLPKLCEGKRVSVEVREEGGSEKKRKKGEEEEMEGTMAGSLGVMMRVTRQCRKNHIQNASGSSSGVKNFKKAKHDDPKNKKEPVVYKDNKRKITINRWSAERFHLAEENMLKVMKEKGAVYGNPILRPDLRTEARKYIGDTGLLDHLLKHMAGKLAPGGAERFRRRHNAEGAMEYWLESADLVDIRKEAGIQDPYWTPPPGWKLGDSISQDYVTQRELREVKDEILMLKQEMRDLASKKGEEEALGIVTTPGFCLSSLNSADYGSLAPKQGIYAALVSKKAKLEEQLKEISRTLSGMEGQLKMLKPTTVEEQTVSEWATPPALLPGPITSEAENIGGETRKEKKINNNKETKSAEETQMQEDKEAKIERLKSGFQICKPQGTFVWPNIGLSPQVVTNHDDDDDDHTVVPTPPSASSSTTSAPKLTISIPQTQPLPLQILTHPSSPLKPLAERRPVSTATLTHVTGQFSPSGSTPRSKITTPSITINLNETPLTLTP